jgi:hypothetical protein
MVSPEDVAHDLLQDVAKKPYPRTGRLAHGLRKLRVYPRWVATDGEDQLVTDFNRVLDECDRSLRLEVRFILGLNDDEPSRTMHLTARRKLKYNKASGTAYIAFDTVTLVRFLEQLIAVGTTPAQTAGDYEDFDPLEVVAGYYYEVGPLNSTIGLPVFSGPEPLVLDMAITGVMKRTTRVLTLPLVVAQFLPGPWFPEVRRQTGEIVRSHPAGKFPVDFDRDELGQMLVVGLHDAVYVGETITIDLKFTYRSFEETGLRLPPQNRIRWIASGTERRVMLSLTEDASSDGPAWAFTYGPGEDKPSQPHETTHHFFDDGKFHTRSITIESPPARSSVVLQWSRSAEGPFHS